ncbi:MAG: 5-(carboxyamino)imidazole ribonucleotide mutase [Bacteroidetes bacterium]|nr:5-(carboxyamino)imidazole ribonucleotide mutase [Bacteroidota bacterium]
MSEKKIQVSIIMGSDSDLPVMKEAASSLDRFEIGYEIRIVSAHRTPEFMVQFAKEAESRGIDVIIAGAGGAAHLPGMVASLTPIPVIGVPVKSSNSIEGIDSLLSIVQMPKGIPVATVAINGAANAGLLAARILGVADVALRQKMNTFIKEQTAQVMEKSEKLKGKSSV